jgi:hypothetical protein
MTLGAAAAASVRIIVWCRDCQHHQVEPDPGEQARLYAAETSGSRAPTITATARLRDSMLARLPINREAWADAGQKISSPSTH